MAQNPSDLWLPVYHSNFNDSVTSIYSAHCQLQVRFNKISVKYRDTAVSRDFGGPRITKPMMQVGQHCATAGALCSRTRIAVRIITQHSHRYVQCTLVYSLNTTAKPQLYVHEV